MTPSSSVGWALSACARSHDSRLLLPRPASVEKGRERSAGKRGFWGAERRESRVEVRYGVKPQQLVVAHESPARLTSLGVHLHRARDDVE